MHEGRTPSINLKNTNFINRVEEYQEKARHKLTSRTSQTQCTEQSLKHDVSSSVSSTQVLSKHPAVSRPPREEKSIFEEDYFVKHVYMLKERLVEMFKNSDRIPTEDKRTIEKEFHHELKELKTSLKEIKLQRKTLFAENNEKYVELDRINEELKDEETKQKQRIHNQRKTLAAKYAGGRDATNTDLLKYMVEKDKARKRRDDKVKHKNELKADWDRNKENIRVMEEKIDLIKSKVVFVRGILREYYVNLLKQGTDTRGRGLIWIIQKLDKLGVRVDPLMFPPFLVPLHPYLQNYLEELARRDREVKLLKKKLRKSRTKPKDDDNFSSTMHKKDAALARYLAGKASINEEYDAYLATLRDQLRDTSSAMPTNGRPDRGAFGSSQSLVAPSRKLLPEPASRVHY